MRTNAPMRDLLKGGVQIPEPVKMIRELRRILRHGWVVTPAGALVLRDAGWSGDVKDGEDISDFEWHANDLDVSMEGVEIERDRFLAIAAARAFTFAGRGLARAAGLVGSDLLVALVDVPVGEEFATSGVTVHFVSARPELPTWFFELERFKESALAVVANSDFP